MIQGKQMVSDALQRRMAHWYSERPSFALMGEFSAGKSTLLNVLLGQPLVPAKVTATKLPVIWMTYGPETTWQGYLADGTYETQDGTALNWDDWDKYAVVRMTLDNPLLKLCDVVDTPGISDPRIARGSLQFISDYIDFSVWCTAANQAWRQSEKAAWSALPSRLREHSILAITRADQLGQAADLQKVVKRMNAEAASLFRDIRPISSVDAMRAEKDSKIVNPILWTNSGAEGLLNAIKTSIKAAQMACSQREKLDVPEVPEIVQIEQHAKRVDEVDNDQINEIIQKFHKEIDQADLKPAKNKITTTVEHLRGLLSDDMERDEAHIGVLVRCLSVGNSRDFDVSRVLKQVEQEVADFAKGAWCRLDET